MRFFTASEQGYFLCFLAARNSPARCISCRRKPSIEVL
ncbi:zinc-ribbon domain containing protein [Erwinia amylovora]